MICLSRIDNEFFESILPYEKRSNTMSIAKERMREIIESQPDDASYER
jgi:hypothetical protein